MMAMNDCEIQVHVRRTGEMVTMKVTPFSTTYGQIVEYVCQKIKDSEPNHYYVTMDYKVEMENDTMFKPEDKDHQFKLIMRTEQLLLYIAEMQLRRKQANNKQAETTDEVLASTPIRSEADQVETPEIPSGEQKEETPLSTIGEERRPGILHDVVRSTISRIPRLDVQQYLHEALEKSFDILLMGSPRVGKSTLINAIMKKDVAKTSAGRNACTTAMESYEYQETYTSSIEEGQTTTSICSIRIWDAPGIEDWTKIDMADHLQKLIHNRNPICLIYCASPGSSADLEHIQTIVDECNRLKIFIAMVVTNMYASNDSLVILDTFKQILARHSNQTKVDGSICHYGSVGLCAEVNSVEYKVRNTTMQPTGVHELMLAIMGSLSEEKLLQWCFAIMDNGPFWIRGQSTIWKMFGFVKLWTPFSYVKNLIGY